MNGTGEKRSLLHAAIPLRDCFPESLEYPGGILNRTKSHTECWRWSKRRKQAKRRSRSLTPESGEKGPRRQKGCWKGKTFLTFPHCLFGFSISNCNPNARRWKKMSWEYRRLKLSGCILFWPGGGSSLHAQEFRVRTRWHLNLYLLCAGVSHRTQNTGDPWWRAEMCRSGNCISADDRAKRRAALRRNHAIYKRGRPFGRAGGGIITITAWALVVSFGGLPQAYKKIKATVNLIITAAYIYISNSSISTE